MNAQNQTFTINHSGEPSGLMSRGLLLVETDASSYAESLHAKLDSEQIRLLEVLSNVKGLPDKVQQLNPDILVLSVDFLDAATLDQVVKVNLKAPLPVIFFAKLHAPEVLRTVVASGVSSYIVDDIRAHRLPVIIDLAVARFKQIQSLSSELQSVKAKLSERKLIERAKGIIMKQKRLSEADAYSQMRRSAMNQGQSIAGLSKRIIDVFEVLD